MSELRRLRKNRGLTQAELARRVGVNQSLIASIELGYYRPYPRIRRRIAEVLGVLPEDIWPEAGVGKEAPEA